MSHDIRPILADWSFNPSEVTVRKIIGDDRREKIQLRLDMGMLQMELNGRPDGKRPGDFDSCLDMYQDRLDKHRKINGTDLGFELTTKDCQALRAEAVMYYHRYLSLFVLEDFDRVERDTAQNLRVFDLMSKYAADSTDRLAAEPYRPYLVMMNTRAKANMAMEIEAYRSALAHVDAGLRTIGELLEAHGHPDAYKTSAEVMILKALREEVMEQTPMDPLATLQRDMERALDDENYEQAARLRDQIAAIQRKDSASSP